TAERFVPHPAGGGARLYRTGDRARLLSSGELEFLGRDDHQVKVRGYRIELGEIEEALRVHAGVADAAAAVHGELDDRQLVAYVVAADGPPPSADELRAHLQRTLPRWMVPARFESLDALPLTPNGKVDRK